MSNDLPLRAALTFSTVDLDEITPSSQYVFITQYVCQSATDILLAAPSGSISFSCPSSLSTSLGGTRYPAWASLRSFTSVSSRRAKRSSSPSVRGSYPDPSDSPLTYISLQVMTRYVLWETPCIPHTDAFTCRTTSTSTSFVARSCMRTLSASSASSARTSSSARTTQVHSSRPVHARSRPTHTHEWRQCLVGSLCSPRCQFRLIVRDPGGGRHGL